MKIHSTLLLLIQLLTFEVMSQLGCTDTNATNFNSSATINDGSCVYPLTSISCPVIAHLSTTINETSGIVFLNSYYITHNDSGDNPILYFLNQNDFTIDSTKSLTNGTNVDWEDLAQSSTHLFIGDFGNNMGNRTDLKIYKIEKNEIAIHPTLNSEIISFNYPDQLSFAPSSSHNYDCEALIYLNDSLHLFTKHSSNGYTKHYVLPSIPGNYSANLRDSIFIDGQVTSATINESGLIALIGYTPPTYTPFMYLLWDYSNYQLFNGNKRKIVLGNVLTMGQLEAITFHDEYSGVITSEEVNSPINISSKSYSFSVQHLFSNLTNLMVNFNQLESKIYPNPFVTDFLIELSGNFTYQLTNLNGRPIQFGEANDTLNLSMENLENGIYILLLKTEKMEQNFRLIKQ